MKKNMKRKSYRVSPRSEPGMAGLIERLQQQLSSIERKIDSLIGQSPSRPSEARNFTKPDNNYRERTLYKAICADCKKGCEVPFKPSGERPVYCKDCFAKRRNNNPFRARDNMPKIPVSVHAPQPVRRDAAENRKPTEKRRPVFAKKHKKRS